MRLCAAVNWIDESRDRIRNLDELHKRDIQALQRKLEEREQMIAWLSEELRRRTA